MTSKSAKIFHLLIVSCASRYKKAHVGMTVRVRKHWPGSPKRLRPPGWGGGSGYYAPVLYV